MYGDLKAWLKYWKNNLADSDRKKIEVATNPIIVDQYFISQVPKKHADFLWRNSQTNKSTQYISVDISPCSFKSEYEHGKANGKEEFEIFPFWTPAEMSKDGNLPTNE